MSDASVEKRDSNPGAEEAEDNHQYDVGDLVWARRPNSTFYPAVVTPDPHFKFHTKIVKSDPGFNNTEDSSHRQYHLQFLGDNRRLWLPRQLIIAYQGLEHYERLVTEDLDNFNKIYKPKSESSKSAWREAVMVAQNLENTCHRDRVSRCELARAMERGGNKAVVHKKLELELQKKNSDRSPEKFKSPPASPRKSSDSEDKKRSSANYNRRDELQYKMNKMSESDKKKRRSDEIKSEDTKQIIPFNVFDSSTTPTFNRSFKIKTLPAKEKDESSPDVKSQEYLDNTTELKESAENKVDNTNENEAPSDTIQTEINETVSADKLNKSKLNSEDLNEGCLVWAKQRVGHNLDDVNLILLKFLLFQGYPHWPAVITRDPQDGEFVKCQSAMSDSAQLKSQRKMHVLFLEYNNQRAWLPSSALTKFTSRDQFKEAAVKAGASKKKDFVPSKRYQAQFTSAVEFSETLLLQSDEDRLETVFHKYGWVMVSETELSPQPNKKRKINNSDKNGEAEAANKSTDSETDSHQADLNQVNMHRLSSSDRRSSTEAESRLDPAVDTQDGDHDATSTSVSSGVKKKKRESSLVAAIAMNGDSSSDDNLSDSERRFSKKSKLSKSVKSQQQSPEESVSTPVNNSSSSRVSDEEFPRLGDLVWGRMSGYPFWPCFVTKCPKGTYKRPGPNGKSNYHVQFFNWNDESGWVNSVLEFDGLDSFKKIAGNF